MHACKQKEGVYEDKDTTKHLTLPFSEVPLMSGNQNDQNHSEYPNFQQSFPQHLPEGQHINQKLLRINNYTLI